MEACSDVWDLHDKLRSYLELILLPPPHHDSYIQSSLRISRQKLANSMGTDTAGPSGREAVAVRPHIRYLCIRPGLISIS